jgi:hypothetical protein
MFPRSMLFSRALVTGALVLVGGATARAQLASKSPFLPPQAAASNTPTADAPLEFGGYMDTPAEGRLYRVLVKDPARKTAVWAKLNERNPDLDLVIKQHDDDQATLTIEHGGKTLTLAEKKAKVISSGAAAQPMPPPPVPVPAPAPVPAAVTQAVVLNPTPADEQKRLEAVAAEVARRRALREQATQQINQPPPQPVPQVAPQQQQQRYTPPVNQRPALPITRPQQR